MKSDELVVLGAVTKPHGLNGKVHAVSFNADPYLLTSLDELCLRDPKSGVSKKVQINECYVPKHRKLASANAMLLMRFEGVTSVEMADALRGHELCIRRGDLPPLEGDDFYLVDLVGLSAVREGETLGTVLRVLEYPTTDCAEIRCEGGLRELPLVPPWLESVDVAGGKLHVGAWEDLPLQGQKKKKKKKTAKPTKSDKPKGGS